MNQAITFLTDGGDTVRDLTEGHSPQTCHILDWFHITMRLTVLTQMTKGVPVEHKGEKFEEELERVKWFLWHSNVYKALQVLEWLELDVDAQASPEAIATFLRDHWAIENRLHWRRDVTLREDHSQVRTAGKPEVLAALNNIVLSLMDWLGVRNVPEQMRIFNAFPKLALDLLLGPLTFD